MQNRSVVTATIITLAVAVPAFALAAQNNTDQPSSAQKTADQAFGKVSHDGSNAFRELGMARMAIFDGKSDEAQKDIKAAAASLQAATTDDTAFVKDEADLKAPKGTTQQSRATSGKVQWLPIDGAMTIGEDYVDFGRQGRWRCKGERANEVWRPGTCSGNLEACRPGREFR